MRQFHKGRRLIALCVQKAQSVQRDIARLHSERNSLIERVAQCEAEITALDQVLATLKFAEALITKADIYKQLKQRALLLHQRHDVILDRTLQLERIEEIDQGIVLCQKQLAKIKRKEMKFIRWMQKGKQAWMEQQESINEDEKQDMFPWVM